MVELRGVLKSLGQYPTPVELADLLQRMDANGNGVVSGGAGGGGAAYCRTASLLLLRLPPLLWQYAWVR